MPDNDNIERMGVNAVERAFLKMDWVFREQPISDYGIDAHAEPRVDGVPTGQLIALQIKTGKTYFKRRGDNFVFYGEKRHLDYWRNHVLPVFIILHDPDSQLTIWQRVENHLITENENGRWSINIPPQQILDERAAQYLRHGISSDASSVRRFRLAVDMPLIREVAEKAKGDAVFLTVTEWVNKSLNFRESQLRFGDPDGEPAYEFDTWMPAGNINEVMAHYFPWLDYEYAAEIETHAGEVDEHVLEVKLNELGLAFITVEDFVEFGGDIKDVESPGHSDDDDDPEDYWDDDGDEDEDEDRE